METEKDIRTDFEAYPHKMNKYIHKEARNKLIKMGIEAKIGAEVKAPIKFKEVPKRKIPSPEGMSAFKHLKLLNMSELRDMAKEKGLKNYSRLKEDDLIRLILQKK